VGGVSECRNTEPRYCNGGLLPPLIDIHEDISFYNVTGGAGQRFPWEDFSKDSEKREADLPKFKRANARLIFSAIAPLTYTISDLRVTQLTKGYGIPTRAMRTRASTMLTLQHFATYYELQRRHSDRIKLVLSPEDLRMMETGDRIGFLISIEGAEPIEDVEDLEIFYRLGMRSLGLAWNFDNKYAASCMSGKDYGLTGDGEALVSLCNEFGVILDLAHASKRTSMDLLSMSRLPAIVSHANASHVKEHVRNVDDEELDALKKNGGVVGVTLISPTISGTPSVKTLADHVLYIRDNFGSEMLAVGTDYFGLGEETPQVVGLEDITKMGNLWSELETRGLRSDEIEGISYRNALRVVQGNSAKWK
jgi:membrane dipeptidase